MKKELEIHTNNAVENVEYNYDVEEKVDDDEQMPISKSRGATTNVTQEQRKTQ